MQPMKFVTELTDLTDREEEEVGRSSSGPQVVETIDGFTIESIFAGVRASDLKVSWQPHGGYLKVEGKRSNSARGFRADKHFSFQVPLPRSADVAKATVEHIDGVLTIQVPKRAFAPVFLTASADPPLTDDEQSADERYQLTLSLPGLSARDLSISLHEDGEVKLSGETKRTGARVNRRYRVPRDADLDGAHASHVDGILTVAVPKKRAREDAERQLEVASVRAKVAPAEVLSASEEEA